ncbi:MAG: hypothetical protein P4L87_25300 [Formivibrio sp.]|nr:hypothetical protein [Formivibrio sp.]
MLSWPKGKHDGLKVIPHWPSKQVCISEMAWERLLIVQSQLPESICLIVTRGYEPSASRVGISRKLFRAIGIYFFRHAYKFRRDELEAIFGTNGHDVDGNHIDVSVALNGRRLRFLPLGVFTPLTWQNQRSQKYTTALHEVKTALVDQGFCIHKNMTESLQIHCDLVL